jgi:acyl-CoA thioester hydrolase
MNALASASRLCASAKIKVAFYDLDPVGIVWHGNYAKYFEVARCVLLDQINYGYEEMKASGYLWPVIDLRVRYIKPLVFGQDIRVQATLKEWENRLLIDYLITDEQGTRMTKGTTVQVAVDLATKEMCLASPAVLLERLEIKE